MDFFTSSGPERCNSNPDRNTNPYRNTNPDENTNPSAKKATSQWNYLPGSP